MYRIGRAASGKLHGPSYPDRYTPDTSSIWRGDSGPKTLQLSPPASIAGAGDAFVGADDVLGLPAFSRDDPPLYRFQNSARLRRRGRWPHWRLRVFCL